MAGDLIERAVSLQAASGNDRDPMADPRQLRKDVAGHEQCLAALGQAQEQLAHLDARLRIEPVRRLVED